MGLQKAGYFNGFTEVIGETLISWSSDKIIRNVSYHTIAYLQKLTMSRVQEQGAGA